MGYCAPMAKGNSKKGKPLTVRNWAAVAAFQRSGAGKHVDGRTRRQRTRGAAKRQALKDWS